MQEAGRPLARTAHGPLRAPRIRRPDAKIKAKAARDAERAVIFAAKEEKEMATKLATNKRWHRPKLQRSSVMHYLNVICLWLIIIST